MSETKNVTITVDGKKIAGGPGTAVHDTISILLKAAHAENVKIDWVAVQPQLANDWRQHVRGPTSGTATALSPAAVHLRGG